MNNALEKNKLLGELKAKRQHMKECAKSCSVCSARAAYINAADVFDYIICLIEQGNFNASNNRRTL